jgi:RNA polymerase sigma-70 factor (ECF subfamily)
MEGDGGLSTRGGALLEAGAVSAEGVDLIARIAQGDREAFGRFYDAFAPLAFGVIRRILQQPGDAEDVLQEVFWEIWRLAGRYEPGRGAPAAWVVTRARSRAIDRLRSLRKRDEVGVEAIDSVATTQRTETGADLATRVHDRELVRGVLGHLQPPQREVVELAFFGGLSHTEIATRLEQPLGTVKTRMRAALKRMRELLDRPAGERGS